MSEWSEHIEPMMRERAYRTIDSDPQVLLETDGGPAGIDADLFYARLIGFDGQIEEDGLRIAGAVPYLLKPIPVRPIFTATDADQVRYEMEPARTARYVLQSGFATMRVDVRYAPADVPLRPDMSVIVAYLRYRRRT